MCGEDILSPWQPPLPVSQGLFTAPHVPHRGLQLTLPSNCGVWMLADLQGLGLLGPYLAPGCDCCFPSYWGVSPICPTFSHFTPGGPPSHCHAHGAGCLPSLSLWLLGHSMGLHPFSHQILVPSALLSLPFPWWECPLPLKLPVPLLWKGAVSSCPADISCPSTLLCTRPSPELRTSKSRETGSCQSPCFSWRLMVICA